MALEGLQSDFQIESKIAEQMQDAVQKAWEALSGYKFWMFGYHAARWVQLNRLCGPKNPNPFFDLVQMAREKIDKKP